MEFFDLLLTYPVFIYTTLLGVVLVYWMFALIGLVDFETTGPDMDVDIDVDIDIDVDVDVDVDVDTDIDAGDVSHHHHLDGDVEANADGEARNIGTLASWLISLGLTGVPFSVVVSLLMLFSWVICCLAILWLIPLVPTEMLRFAAGTAICIASFALSIPVTAVCVRPLRKLFVVHRAITNADLVGRECVMFTGSVDENFGQAEIPTHGASLHIPVMARTPNNLKRGDTAIVVSYDAEKQRFLIAEKKL
jgi:hypothetical protein